MALQVSPAGVVGRDRLIERIWQRLKSKSVRFLAERRVGKTSVLKKMAAEPIDGFHPSCLDHIACEDQPQSIDDVWAAVKSKMALNDRDAVIELLSLLAQDHYLITADSKRYTFRFPLIRRWWFIAHGLAQGGR